MVDYYAKLEEIVDRTEEIIEREGLRSVFAALAEICSAKARTKPHNIVALDALQHTSRSARRGPSRRNTVSPSSTDQGGGKLAVNIDQTAKSESNAA